MPRRKGTVASLQRDERKSTMTIVPLSHFLAPVISGLCKHSGQPKGSITQENQSSSKAGTVRSIEYVLYLVAQLL